MFFSVWHHIQSHIWQMPFRHLLCDHKASCWSTTNPRNPLVLRISKMCRQTEAHEKHNGLAKHILNSGNQMLWRWVRMYRNWKMIYSHRVATEAGSKNPHWVMGTRGDGTQDIGSRWRGEGQSDILKKWATAYLDFLLHIVNYHSLQEGLTDHKGVIKVSAEWSPPGGSGSSSKSCVLSEFLS